MSLAMARYHEVCSLDETWEWKELIYKGSALAKGAKYFLDIDFNSGTKVRRYMLTVHVHTFDKETKKYLMDFKECELSPHGICNDDIL